METSSTRKRQVNSGFPMRVRIRIGFQFLMPFFCSWYWGRKSGGFRGRFEGLIEREALRRREVGGGLERDWFRACSSWRRSELERLFVAFEAIGGGR